MALLEVRGLTTHFFTKNDVRRAVDGIHFTVEEGETFGLKLPHDPEYSIEEFKQPHRPQETSRIVMMDGRWKTVRSQGY